MRAHQQGIWGPRDAKRGARHGTCGCTSLDWEAGGRPWHPGGPARRLAPVAPGEARNPVRRRTSAFNSSEPIGAERSCGPQRPELTPPQRPVSAVGGGWAPHLMRWAQGTHAAAPGWSRGVCIHPTKPGSGNKSQKKPQEGCSMPPESVTAVQRCQLGSPSATSDLGGSF